MQPWALAVLALVSLANVDACGVFGLDDPEGDVIVFPMVPSEALGGRPSLDFLRYETHLTPENLTLAVQLAQAPGNGEFGYNRYWIGFHVRTSGAWELMDVRIGQTSTYERGFLIGPGSLDHPRMAELPLHWSGNNFTIVIPWSLMTDTLGPRVKVSGLAALSDGPSPLLNFQGAPTALFMDWVRHAPGIPLEACVDEEPLPATQVAAVPLPGSLLVVALLGLGFLVRRRA
jgi:hypothetical protein